MRKRYLKMRKLLRMMAVSTMGVYSLFGMNTSVDAIPNYQLNGITVYADKGNGTLVRPLGEFVD